MFDSSLQLFAPKTTNSVPSHFPPPHETSLASKIGSALLSIGCLASIAFVVTGALGLAGRIHLPTAASGTFLGLGIPAFLGTFYGLLHK